MANRRKDGQPAKRHAGKQAGAAVVVTRKMANEIANSGESPLSVMHENMLFWHRHALSLEQQLGAIIIDLQQPDPELVRDAMKTLGGLVEARSQSQKCAVDLAPYVHPRLQTIAFTGHDGGAIKHVVSGMSAKEAADAYQTTLQGTIA